MKAFIGTQRTDWSMRRVVEALARYAPEGVEISEDRSAADLIVIHAIGRNERTRRKPNGCWKEDKGTPSSSTPCGAR